MNNASCSSPHGGLSVKNIKNVDRPTPKCTINKLRTHSKPVSHLSKGIWQSKDQRPNLAMNNCAGKELKKKEKELVIIKHFKL